MTNQTHGRALRYLRFAACLVALVATGAGGCNFKEKVVHRCAEIPKGAVPQPLGTYACQWQTAQMTAAELDDFVIHQYEWKGKTTELGPFGQRHVKQIAHRIQETPFPIVISPSDDPALNETRRLRLAETLAALGTPVEFERIVVDHGIAEPLYGIEAPGISGGYLQGSGSLQGRGNSQFGFGQQNGGNSLRGGSFLGGFY